MDRATVPEDVFFIDRARPVPLQAQIRETLVSAILSGRLRAGTRLPSSRRLARYLGVSRITVTTAYQQLVAQDYLASRDRSAYLVAEDPPTRRLHAEEDANRRDSIDWSAKLGTELREMRRIEKPLDWRTYPYPFIYGQMDWSLFDHSAWRDCARQALGRRDFEEMAGDVYAADDPMLVDYICRRNLPRRGIAARPDEVLVTLGAQNALWLTIQLLSRGGLHAVCENPGYPDIAHALRWSGARVTPIDVDGDGLPPEALPAGVEAVFVTPSHHAPTAVTMPMERRQRLLAAAREEDFLIVEDDYDFEMSFLGAPSPSLKSLDRSGRVIYTSSFSKALFPGLRLGYLVGPAPFIAEARRLRTLMLRHPPGHLQRTAAYFLALGHYDQLIRRMRTAFAERRALLVEAIEHAGLELGGAPAFGGANLWVGGPEGTDSSRLAAEAREEGVLIEPGAPFFGSTDRPVRFFRMAYSSIAPKRIADGVGILADCARFLPADR